MDFRDPLIDPVPGDGFRSAAFTDDYASVHSVNANGVETSESGGGCSYTWPEWHAAMVGAEVTRIQLALIEDARALRSVQPPVPPSGEGPSIYTLLDEELRRFRAAHGSRGRGHRSTAPFVSMLPAYVVLDLPRWADLTWEVEVRGYGGAALQVCGVPVYFRRDVGAPYLHFGFTPLLVPGGRIAPEPFKWIPTDMPTDRAARRLHDRRLALALGAPPEMVARGVRLVRGPDEWRVEADAGAWSRNLQVPPHVTDGTVARQLAWSEVIELESDATCPPSPDRGYDIETGLPT